MSRTTALRILAAYLSSRGRAGRASPTFARERQLTALYATLRRLLQAGEQESEAEVSKISERLRALQRAEAEQMGVRFSSRRVLPQGEGWKALGEAARRLDRELPPTDRRSRPDAPD